MADSDTNRKRKESGSSDPSLSTTERAQQKRKPSSTLDAVRSWVGFTSSKLQAKNEEDGNRNDNSDKGVLQALEDLKQITTEQVKLSREADKMRRIEFALQSLGNEEDGGALITDEFFQLGKLDVRAGLDGGPSGKAYNYKYEVRGTDYLEVVALLRDILWSFREGAGHTMEKKDFIALDLRLARVNEIKEVWCTNFKIVLIRKLLHKLLGKEPRCENSSDGETMTLHYE